MVYDSRCLHVFLVNFLILSYLQVLFQNLVFVYAKGIYYM